MRKFSENKSNSKKPKNVVKLSDQIYKILESYLSLEVSGPIHHHHMEGSIRIKGKKLSSLAIMELLKNVTNNKEIEILEKLKLSSNNKVDNLNVFENTNIKNKLDIIYKNYKNNISLLDKKIQNKKLESSNVIKYVYHLNEMKSNDKYDTNILNKLINIYKRKI